VPIAGPPAIPAQVPQTYVAGLLQFLLLFLELELLQLLDQLLVLLPFLLLLLLLPWVILLRRRRNSGRGVRLLPPA
jgi:uncharacterized membrane protein YjgN (DUF898 family)